MATPQSEKDKKNTSGPTCKIWLSLFLSLFVLFASVFLALKAQSFYFNTIQKQQTEQLANAIERLLSTQYTLPCRQLSKQPTVIENASHQSLPDNRHILELLQTTKDILSVSIVYVMDNEGTVTASSKTSSGKGLTGENYKFRPYFSDAIKGRESRYAAVGVTTNERGLYFSAPIFGTAGAPVGVVVIKSGIQQIQVELSESSFQHAALISDSGIVFVVSETDKDWLYHASLPLSPAQKATLVKSRQFADNPLTDLPISFDENTTSIDSVPYTIHTTPVALNGWKLVSLEKQQKKFPVILLILIPGSLLSYLFISKIRANNNEKLLKEEMEEEILQRRSVQEQLLIAKEAAEAANIAKSDFLANISHEIRTPMNGIMGMTTQVLNSILTEEQRKQLEIVDSSAQRLLGLINSILDFSKIEAGKMEIEEVPFVLDEKLDEVFSMMAVKAEKQKVILSLESRDSIPPVLIGDPDRLLQIFINLVNNALKFTEQGSVKILVQCNKSDSDSVLLQFGVQDTGIGIPLEKQGVIFDSFAQADSSTTRKYGGTGLGLSISSQLVKLLGGEIWLESEEGKGATFWFTAYFKLPNIGSEALVSAQDTVEKNGIRWRSILSNREILLVEDEPINMILAKAVLEKEHIHITTAQNGLEAVDHYMSRAFDCILMDIQMPEMDGYQTTAVIRSHEQEYGGHIPIIAMTAHATQGDRQKCLAAGMDDYVTKPLHTEDIFNAIEKQLQNSLSIAADATDGVRKA
ncbi:signal transduction histidine kinase regulating C4-dicarboxylate transport system [Desulfocapsa sulfexigens DSM 10523]|uniref:Sensory/regulatory protein RpfC n=1 Tax=Desulfocapsa sulfexigens (strain DSM 10523 / SB164P1) TaxID=1167006 RepID=M1PNW0_DESSD|nr:signal transduction histidine kinase regulating C4-dicarboxylate transport system [Desulfocapsa sulfexigens DSM 10523]